MGYIYIYRINTPTGAVVIKVGHGKTPPEERMNEYTEKYGLDTDFSSLHFISVYDSQQIEGLIHNKLINSMGYRNIRNNNYGPQELFQAPRNKSYKNVYESVLNLAREFNNNDDYEYKASDLVNGSLDSGAVNRKQIELRKKKIEQDRLHQQQIEKRKQGKKLENEKKEKEKKESIINKKYDDIVDDQFSPGEYWHYWLASSFGAYIVLNGMMGVNNNGSIFIGCIAGSLIAMFWKDYIEENKKKSQEFTDIQNKRKYEIDILYNPEHYISKPLNKSSPSGDKNINKPDIRTSNIKKEDNKRVYYVFLYIALFGIVILASTITTKTMKESHDSSNPIPVAQKKIIKKNTSPGISQNKNHVDTEGYITSAPYVSSYKSQSSEIDKINSPSEIELNAIAKPADNTKIDDSKHLKYNQNNPSHVTPKLISDPLISEAQSLLAALGYNPGPIDGVFGLRTKSAIKAFRFDNALPLKNNIDENLLFILRNSVRNFQPAETKETGELALIQRNGHEVKQSRELPKAISGLQFVKVPRGCFQMGSNNMGIDEKPAHQVCINRDFYIGKYEVTQKEWRSVMGNNPSFFKDCGDDCPVEMVSWDDVQYFTHKLNILTGKKYRLPTEAEWEYACRSGGIEQLYCGSNSINEIAWYINNSGRKKIRPVGQKQANFLGLYDMSGNVWEWVHDWYGKKYYKNTPKNNPKGPSHGSQHVARGGSGDSVADSAQASYRNFFERRSANLGFRLVRNL